MTDAPYAAAPIGAEVTLIPHLGNSLRRLNLRHNPCRKRLSSEDFE
jgi:hypothetical protein